MNNLCHLSVNGDNVEEVNLPIIMSGFNLIKAQGKQLPLDYEPNPLGHRAKINESFR